MMPGATEIALLHILERPTRAWIARLRREDAALHARRIATRVVDTLCKHVVDARAHREALVDAMVRFVQGLTAPDRSAGTGSWKR